MKDPILRINKDGVVDIHYETTEGVKSKRGNSWMLFTTNGFLDLTPYGYPEQAISIHHIRKL